jgi:hypothetical protein
LNLATVRYRIITAGTDMITGVIGARHSHHFQSGSEHIADAAFSLDSPRCARIDLQLGPQPQDLDIDASIKNIFVNPGWLATNAPVREAAEVLREGHWN